jgi:succinyl-CoA synthetase beta subunit
MVNGAGLAMATMDMIKLYGGQPANFLDIGGSSNPQKVIDAMNLILSDKNVKVVMINIFGGITRCDDVAKGLIAALEQIKINIPIVIRLSGTNSKEGLEILKKANLPIVETMSEAAEKAIRLCEDFLL